MPKNNGKRRKAWRKEAADFNAAWWARMDPEHAWERKGDEAVYIFSKPYARRGQSPAYPVRPSKPDTKGA